MAPITRCASAKCCPRLEPLKSALASYSSCDLDTLNLDRILSSSAPCASAWWRSEDLADQPASPNSAKKWEKAENRGASETTLWPKEDTASATPGSNCPTVEAPYPGWRPLGVFFPGPFFALLSRSKTDLSLFAAWFPCSSALLAARRRRPAEAVPGPKTSSDRVAGLGHSPPAPKAASGDEKALGRR